MNTNPKLKVTASPSWMRAYGVWAIVISILTSIGSATIYLKSEMEDIIQHVVNVHDHGYQDDKMGPSHRDLRDSNAVLLQQVTEIKVQNDADRSDLIQAYWYLIGYTVADAEPVKQIRAAAAAHYRNEFLLKCKTLCSELNVDRCRRDGKPYIQDVYRLVISSTWIERSSLVRSIR